MVGWCYNYSLSVTIPISLPTISPALLCTVQVVPDFQGHQVPVHAVRGMSWRGAMDRAQRQVRISTAAALYSCTTVLAHKLACDWLSQHYR